MNRTPIVVALALVAALLPGSAGAQSLPVGPSGVANCPAVPFREASVPIAFTVAALLETHPTTREGNTIEPGCLAQLFAYDAATDRAYLVDLRAWRYQVIEAFLPGREITRVIPSHTDPYYVILGTAGGFVGVRWPVWSIPWRPVPLP